MLTSGEADVDNSFHGISRLISRSHSFVYWCAPVPLFEYTMCAYFGCLDCYTALFASSRPEFYRGI